MSVRKAFLYGSYSDNSASEDSDIDVLLISDGFEESNDKLVGRVWCLTSKVNSRIEPIMIGTKNYESSENSPLITKVKQTGIQIV
ncbi:nucleotidyltransferase domain-containing protein [Algoriphagus boritolerans]|uniref:nucleotidyltransferase domain-containing protein n=1 Tax=Algoriphagus boritolerans TaxID=308111 RepID=UPI003A103936